MAQETTTANITDRIKDGVEFGAKLRKASWGIYGDLFSRARKYLDKVQSETTKYIDEMAEKGDDYETRAQNRLKELREDPASLFSEQVDRIDDALPVRVTIERKTVATKKSAPKKSETAKKAA